MSIKNYVDVGISLESANLARLGFNTVMFLVEDDVLDRTNIVSTGDFDNDDLGGTESELYKAFQTYLSQPLVAPTAVIGCKRTTDDTWADAISAIRDENDSWYGVVSVTKEKADILAISAVVETLSPGRLHFAVTADESVLANEEDGSADGNVAQRLAEAGYYRTALIYSTDDGYANAGQSAILSRDPGSYTANYKELAVIKAETITAQERANLIEQNCQVQRTVAGLKRTVDSGMVASGEWLDNIHSIDWLTARISENIFAILATQPKLPFTNAGGAVLGTELERNLVVASSAPFNFINPDFTIFVPNVDNISAVDKANRKFEGITFTANIQGAIHALTIRGTLVV